MQKSLNPAVEINFYYDLGPLISRYYKPLLAVGYQFSSERSVWQYRPKRAIPTSSMRAKGSQTYTIQYNVLQNKTANLLLQSSLNIANCRAELSWERNELCRRRILLNVPRCWRNSKSKDWLSLEVSSHWNLVVIGDNKSLEITSH